MVRNEITELCQKYVAPYVGGLDCYDKTGLIVFAFLFFIGGFFLLWALAPLLLLVATKIGNILLKFVPIRVLVSITRNLLIAIHRQIQAVFRRIKSLLVYITVYLFPKPSKNKNVFITLVNSVLNASLDTELSEQEYKTQVEQIVANLQKEQVSSYTVEQARQKQYDNLLQILEQAIEVESIVLLRELVESAAYNTAITSNIDTETNEEAIDIKSKPDTTINVLNINTPNSALDTMLEHTLDICYKRVKQRFDNTSWFVLAYAFGSEHNLEQYIKDKLIKTVLDSATKQT